MKKVLYILKNILIIIGGISYLLSWMEPLHHEIIKDKAEKGMPKKCYNSKLNYFAEITSYAVTKDILYVLFDTKHELKCYTLSGEYLHSFLYAGYDNGRAQLHRKGACLYLEDREHNFYVFEGGKFVEYLDFITDAQIIEVLQSEFDNKNVQGILEDNASFYTRSASIWKKSDSGLKEVLHRPCWTMLFYRKWLLCQTLVSTLLYFLIRGLLKRL